MTINNIDQMCQLHEHIEIHYYVDHYEARIFTQDGQYKSPWHGKGDGIIEALNNLFETVKGKELSEIRQPINGEYVL